MPGLYTPSVGSTPNFESKANQYASNAINAYSALTKDTGPKDPGKTIGGAVGSGTGMAIAGGTAANMGLLGTAVSPGVGTAIGFGAGVLEYLLS